MCSVQASALGATEQQKSKVRMFEKKDALKGKMVHHCGWAAHGPALLLPGHATLRKGLL